MAEREFTEPEKQRLALGDCYLAVFGSPDGELVLRDLLREGGVIERGIPVDGEAAMWAAGRRDLALYVLEQLRLGEAHLIASARARGPDRGPELPREAADFESPPDEEVLS